MDKWHKYCNGRLVVVHPNIDDTGRAFPVYRCKECGQVLDSREPWAQKYIESRPYYGQK